MPKKKAPFRAKNPAFCRYHSCAAAPRRHLQARGEETADGEVNRARTKRRLFLRRCLSATTMSHSSAPRWALINSNFTFWPTSPLRSAPQPPWSSGSSPLRCPPDPAINASCQMTSASVHVSNLALPFLLRKTSHFYSLALTHDIWVSSFVPLVLTKEFHILKWLIGYESYLFGACGHFLGGFVVKIINFSVAYLFVSSWLLVWKLTWVSTLPLQLPVWVHWTQWVERFLNPLGLIARIHGILVTSIFWAKLSRLIG